MNYQNSTIDPVKKQQIQVSENKIHWRSLPSITKKSVSFIFTSPLKFSVILLALSSFIVAGTLCILFAIENHSQILYIPAVILFSLSTLSIYGYLNLISDIDSGREFSFKVFFCGLKSYIFEQTILAIVTALISVFIYLIIEPLNLNESILRTIRYGYIDDIGGAIISLIIQIGILIPIISAPIFSIYLLLKCSKYKTEITLSNLIRSPFIALKKNYIMIVLVLFLFSLISAILLLVFKLFIFIVFPVFMGLFFFLGEHAFEVRENTVTL